MSGELNRHSAHTLEAEIERLCKEDITGITLDLRDLSHVDSIGVAVIAFRSRFCKRLGYEFAVIPGSKLVRRACEQAGLTDMTGAAEDDAVVPSTDQRGARRPFPRRLRAAISGAREFEGRGISSREEASRSVIP